MLKEKTPFIPLVGKIQNFNLAIILEIILGFLHLNILKKGYKYLKKIGE
jgi:hypothetical protein